MRAQELSTTTCFPGKTDRKLPLVSDEPDIVRISPSLKKTTKKNGRRIAGRKIFLEAGLKRRGRVGPRPPKAKELCPYCAKNIAKCREHMKAKRKT
jgi:hypothetical protein